MPGEFDGNHLKLWTPATYRIEVEGVLEKIWADSLAGMRISSHKRDDQSTVTTIANDGREGIDAIQKNQYDAVLMVIRMPVMDGYTAQKQSGSGKEGSRLKAKGKKPVFA